MTNVININRARCGAVPAPPVQLSAAPIIKTGAPISANKMRLDEVLREHAKWIVNHRTGKRADFCGADLKGVNLSGVDLWGADFRGADLRGSNLCGTNLRFANLSGANLECANLTRTNFEKANLCGVMNLRRGGILKNIKRLWIEGA